MVIFHLTSLNAGKGRLVYEEESAFEGGCYGLHKFIGVRLSIKC